METKQATLVILSPGFPKDEEDSTCLTSQQNFVKALNKKYPSLQVIIVSFQYPFTTTEYSWFGNRVIPFNGWKKGKLLRLLAWRRVWRALQNIHKQNQVIGLLGFWCGECALLGNRFSKKYHIKHHCWILGQDAKKENRYVKWINPAAEELIALSDSLSDRFFAEHAIRPGHVIYNGIDTDAFIKTDTERDIAILGVGSLIALKQFDLFIFVVNEIKKIFPQIKAVICGAGPAEKKLKTMISEYGLTGNILLTGELPHAAVLQLMQQSKILLHPSNYEGFSTVCLEALYAGCQVISFVKPTDHDIEHWHTLQTKESMIERVFSILNDPAISYKSVLHVDMKDSAEKIMQLYNYKESTNC
jgi:glycosyltransferase involved in cell wall biosynthesis